MASRLRPIDLTELRGFCLAVELGSLGRAAAAMAMSQPALSKRMRELELFAGAELLHRSPRGVTTTAAGERLYREARALLAHAESVEAVLDTLRQRGTLVRVAASHTIAEYLLPGPLAAFREQTGHAIAVELVAANSVVVRDLVRERRSDLGLAAAIEGDPGTGLLEAPLCDDELAVAVSSAHPWATRDCVTLEEFLATRMVMRDPSSHARRLLDDALRARGLATPLPLAEVGSTAAAVAAAVSGPVPTILSSRAIAAASALRPVRVHGLRLRRRFVLLTREGEPARPARDELRAYLSTAIT